MKGCRQLLLFAEIPALGVAADGGESDGDEEQRGEGAEEQPADDGTS